MINILIPAVTSLLDKFIEDKDEKAKLAHEIATMSQKMAHESAMAQIEVNKEEAKHRSVFVSGWRPSVGWTCALALLYHYLLQPTAIFIAALMGKTVELPVFDMNSLLTVLMGLLGLGGLRTYEKIKNVSK
jgi:hypothetical protein